MRGDQAKTIIPAQIFLPSALLSSRLYCQVSVQESIM